MDLQATSSKRLYYAILVSLFFAAILLQIALFSAEPMLLRDGIFYAERIRAHVECGQLFCDDVFNKPPLLLICGSFLCRYSRLSVESVLLGMNILSHALLVFPIAATGQRLFHSRQTAIFCALLAICTPSLLITALGGTREPFFFLLAACSLAAITAFCDQCSIPALVTGGICAAIGFFARYESLFLLPIEGVMIFGFIQIPTSWKKRLVYCIGYLGSFLAGIGIILCISPTCRTFIRLFGIYLKKFL